MQLNSIFQRVSGRIVSVKLVWIRGNPGLTNADTKEGMDVLVLMAPVEEKWWREDCKAYLGWMEELRNIGFEGDQIRY